MKLYENVVIGNFLYGLGCTIGAQAVNRSLTIPASINLLQQTPADKPLADVLLEVVGAVRLIEFKLAGNRSSKERLKWDVLTKAIANQPEVSALSREVHWFVEIDQKQADWCQRVVPYLGAFDRELPSADLQSLIQGVASDAARGIASHTQEEISNYLLLVSQLQGSDVGEFGSGSLILSVNAAGQLTFSAIDNLLQLRLMHRDVVRQFHDALIEKERKSPQQKVRSQVLDRSPGYER